MATTAMEAAAMEAAGRKLSQDVDNAVSEALTGVQEYIAFNLQRSYYRCATKCFDGPRKSIQDNKECIERCGIPLERAQAVLNNELARFQEKLQRSVMVCRDKMENHPSADSMEVARSGQACVQRSVQEQVSTLPKLADKIMSQIRVKEEPF